MTERERIDAYQEGPAVYRGLTLGELTLLTQIRQMSREIGFTDAYRKYKARRRSEWMLAA